MNFLIFILISLNNGFLSYKGDYLDGKKNGKGKDYELILYKLNKSAKQGNDSFAENKSEIKDSLQKCKKF